MSSEPAGAAPVSPVRPPAPPSAASGRAPVTQWGRARPAVVVLVFLIGLGAGIGLQRVVDPPLPSAPWPPLDGRPEPAAAHAVAAAIAADDARALAAALDAQSVSALGDALDPIVQVIDVRFVGAAGDPTDEVATYLVRGTDAQDRSRLVGFALHVMDGVVAGVNQ